MLGGIGITGPDWLYSTPMLAVILANIWRGTAFSMMVYSAALAEVPPELTEAAQLDGANGMQRLAWVTLPVIRRSISTNLMLTTLQTLSVFTLIYVMTGGGPGTDSSTLPILAYQEAFKFAQVGYGTAIATVMIVVGGIFSVDLHPRAPTGGGLMAGQLPPARRQTRRRSGRARRWRDRASRRPRWAANLVLLAIAVLLPAPDGVGGRRVVRRGGAAPSV